MNLSYMMNIVRNLIDETDDDPQVTTIIKDAINHAYLTIADTVNKKSVTSDLSYSKTIVIPSDCNTLIDLVYKENILNERDYTVKADLILMHSKFDTTVDKIKLYYTKKATKLVNDSDELQIDDKYAFQCALYSAYIYAVHRKKVELASLLASDYNKFLEEGKIPQRLEVSNIVTERNS